MFFGYGRHFSILSRKKTSYTNKLPLSSGVYHVTQYPKHVIDIFNVSELKGFTIDVNLILGAGTPLTEMMEIFLRLSSKNSDFSYLKEFHEHMDLVAHIPVRNVSFRFYGKY